MASQKLSGPGLFRWTEEHRIALYLLKTKFQLDGDDEVRVFSKVFGLENMTRGKMTSQYGERDRDGKGHLWLFRSDDSHLVRRSRQVMEERLYRAMYELDIDEMDDVRFRRLSLVTPGRSQKRSRSTSPLPLSPDPFLEAPTYASQPKQRHRARRRRRAQHALPGSSESEIDDIDERPSYRSVRSEERVVAVRPAKPATPRTPRHEMATVLYNRPFGPVMLTPEEYDRTAGPCEWPKFEVPPPILAFRYSMPCKHPCEPSCLCQTGHFVARRFRRTFGLFDRAIAPSRDHPGSFWDDALNHLQNEQQNSPFVSVSNSLAWVLREAIKKSESNNCDMNISLISLDAAQTVSYYAPQFHHELKRKFYFEKGAWRYPGTNEYLVHYACKPFITLPLSKLMSWASRHQHAGDALRLGDLAQDGLQYNSILAKFKEQNIAFSPKIASAVAKIGTSLFGLTAHTRPELWQALIASICEGWALRPQATDSKTMLAAGFLHGIIQESPAPVDFITQEKLKVAFLTGTKFGLCDRTAVHRPIRFRQMEYRSKNRGFLSPAEILADDYDASKVHLRAYEHIQNAIIENGKRSYMIAEAPVEVGRDGDREEIIFESDENGDED